MNAQCPYPVVKHFAILMHLDGDTFEKKTKNYLNVHSVEFKGNFKLVMSRGSF